MRISIFIIGLVAANAITGSGDILPDFLAKVALMGLANGFPARFEQTSKYVNSWDEFLCGQVQLAIGQRPCNENGTFEQYAPYALNDTSNDSLANSTTEEIITATGYQYEQYEVAADDGYITRLIRIVNPLADRSKLKQPPIMLMHGGLMDQTAYIWASSLQHHPEKYPRTIEDGPITSWNRSIGFVLANNGFDVWLVGTRGCGLENQQKVGAKMNLIAPKSVHDAFWKYSMDQIVEYEIPKQIERVLNITKSKKVSLLTFSFASMMTLSRFASNPNWARDTIQSYVMIAPLLNTNGMNSLIKDVVRKMYTNMDDNIGNILSSVHSAMKLSTRLFGNTLAPKQRAYTLYKFIINLVCGSSAKYRTLLEPTVLSNAIQPTSIMQIKHFSQQLTVGRLQKYDYGTINNLMTYGRPDPPAYNMSNIGVQNWMVITGANDNLGTLDSSRQIVDRVHPRAKKHIVVDGYNHLDLLSAFDNAQLVNYPIMDFFDEHREKL